MAFFQCAGLQIDLAFRKKNNSILGKNINLVGLASRRHCDMVFFFFSFATLAPCLRTAFSMGTSGPLPACGAHP